MIEKLKALFQNLFKENNGRDKRKIFIIIGLIGLLIIIVSNVFGKSDSVKHEPDLVNVSDKDSYADVQQEDRQGDNMTTIENEYEAHLKKMLSKIDGLKDVDVMVNLSSTHIKVYEQNKSIGKQTTEETDKNGGARSVEDETEESEVVIIREGDREVPLLIQTKKPDVKGVLIIASGVEQIEMKKLVIDSVSKVLDVPTHRISVMSKTKGDH